MKITRSGDYIEIKRDDGAGFSMTVDQFSKHARDDAFTMTIAQKAARPDRETARSALLETQVKLLDADILAADTSVAVVLPVTIDPVKLP